ncbi:uncharacterized protein LOC120664497 [Panicum virgatum]|uniref:uncharacterized protein LOC120664497 n=1 Tax=Panicum virgatum TaxID=38727 RepID=UPI0019D5A732|nr:uncharacterized protein LOC120664497 [Panicum virgatum]
MASAQARASVNWEDIKLRTLEKLQELLHFHPDVTCSLRMRELQCTPTASEITPLGLPSSQQTNQPGDSGMKHSRPCDAHFPESFEQAFDSQKGAKRLRTTGEFADEVSRI